MPQKAWHKIIEPREDLRDGRPLEAAEFAVHLDHVRMGTAAPVYLDPKQFFERTYMTSKLAGFGAEVVRRLAGEKTETNAVFNMMTNFGGGKTHALTMLYHLAKHGPEAAGWNGVKKLLEAAKIGACPAANIAVFVGTEFDSISGRGGDDGTPLRKTPWGEIAFQLGGKENFAKVAQHDEKKVAPGGDVLRKIIPADKPCMILLDELINYMNRNRRSGLTGQLYDFIQNLSEFARSRDGMVLAVSIPSLMIEMTQDDEADYDRFSKMLDRLGKAIKLTDRGDTCEIIRRRLFEWWGLPEEAKKICRECADWVQENRAHLPSLFNIDDAQAAFEATYPFHPLVISVFERKWQSLTRFQRTRGVLRLLALWVSEAYQSGYKNAAKEPLITFGSAPFENTLFLSALTEQLGESRLEIPVVTDIAGTKDSHAIRLDKEAVDSIKKANLHRRVASTIFFESNGGQRGDERKHASEGEIRLAVGGPDVDIGNVEPVLDELVRSCYYLSVEGNKYHFSLAPNLNKILNDKQANVRQPDVDERMKREVEQVFATGSGMERVFFPEKSNAIPDRPALTLVTLAPDEDITSKSTMKSVEAMTREHGTSGRTFKSAIIWIGTDGGQQIRESVREILAWEAIRDEEHQLDETQQAQLQQNLKRAKRDITESIWRSYHYLALLNKDNTMKCTDLGLLHSSQNKNMLELITNRLLQDDEMTRGVGVRQLVRNWPAQTEWSTKDVRNAFFASPKFPRLMNGDSIRDTIAKGIADGELAYVGKRADGAYDPFLFGQSVSMMDIEIADEVFIIRKADAKAYLEKQKSDEEGGGPTPQPTENGGGSDGESGSDPGPEPESGEDAPTPTPSTDANISKAKWSGRISPQKWTNFYMKALTGLVADRELSIGLDVQITIDGPISQQKLEQLKSALRDLGLSDILQIDEE